MKEVNGCWSITQRDSSVRKIIFVQRKAKSENAESDYYLYAIILQFIICNAKKNNQLHSELSKIFHYCIYTIIYNIVAFG